MDRELIFKSAEAYLNYDFDDNFCFFYSEIKECQAKSENDSTGRMDYLDCERIFSDQIKSLFKIYECLIIDLEEEKLFGVINEVRPNFLCIKSLKEKGSR